ncbi:MAG: hypothetical protein JRJ85_02570 [Deltaproteobacteria bacterium]|nr:hypothetical protein [Deltaproteobacteria bacterium]
MNEMLQGIENEIEVDIKQILYGDSTSGKKKQWHIGAIKLSNESVIMRKQHGYVGMKLSIKDRVINGKNIGRSNETTPWEQAVKDVNSAWIKKFDSGYVQDINDQTKKLLPMLAKNYRKYPHKVTFPCFVQPKLNGVRCLTSYKNSKVEFTSRKAKVFDTLNHLKGPITDVLQSRDRCILDGELYVYGWNFQQIIRRVKKVRPDSHMLEYWVYDICDTDHIMTFNERNGLVEALLADANELIQIVPSFLAGSPDDIKKYHDRFVGQGYEGIIIRNTNGLYADGLKRSMDLQKYKEFIDAEFVIVGANQGEGTDEGCVVWICETKEGKTFKVRPRGSREMRRQWYDDRKSIIGEILTVRFQEYSERGIPSGNTVGLIIRDYE